MSASIRDLDPRVLRELLHKVEIDDISRLCRTDKRFDDLCADPYYWEERANIQLGVAPWEFMHDGVARNGLARFYEFWIRHGGPCVFGSGSETYPSTAKLKALCLVNNLRAGVPPPSGFTTLGDDYFRALAMLVDPPLAIKIADHGNINESILLNLPHLVSPVTYIALFEWFRTKQGDERELEILRHMLEGKTDEVANLLTERESTPLAYVLTLLLPRVCTSLLACQALVDKLMGLLGGSEEDVFRAIVSSSAGYYGRKDMITELFNAGLYNNLADILGTLLRQEDIERFQELLSQATDRTVYRIATPAYTMSIYTGPGIFLEAIIREIRKRGGSVPLELAKMIFDNQRIDFARALQYWGVDTSTLYREYLGLPDAKPDPLYEARLEEEGIIDPEIYMRGLSN